MIATSLMNLSIVFKRGTVKTKGIWDLKVNIGGI